jgi:hypothetical protein
VKPRGERRRVVSAYVRDRLQRECAVRGEAAKIARVTGFSTAHVTNVQKQDRGVGDDFAEALARHWGLTMAQLEEEATRWASQQAAPQPEPPTSDTEPNRARAAELARDDRVHEAAIQSVLVEPMSDENRARSVLWWAIRMKMREHDMLREAVLENGGRQTTSRS